MRCSQSEERPRGLSAVASHVTWAWLGRPRSTRAAPAPPGLFLSWSAGRHFSGTRPLKPPTTTCTPLPWEHPQVCAQLPATTAPHCPIRELRCPARRVLHKCGHLREGRRPDVSDNARHAPPRLAPETRTRRFAMFRLKESRGWRAVWAAEPTAKVNPVRGKHCTRASPRPRAKPETTEVPSNGRGDPTGPAPGWRACCRGPRVTSRPGHSLPRAVFSEEPRGITSDGKTLATLRQ